MEKKEQIIKTARQLFTLYGYKKVSMDEIAKQANVSKVTIYSYFKDKEELLNFFLKEELSNMKKIINDNYNNKLSFFDNLNKDIISLLEYKRDQQLLLKLTQESIFYNNDNLKKTLIEIDNKITEFIKDKIDTAIKDKKIKKCDSRLIATILFSGYTSVLIKYDEFKSYLSDKEISENLILLLKEGLENRGDTNE